MRIFFAILHAIVCIAVLALCLLEASDALAYYGHEHFALTCERSAVAFLCGTYTVAQLLLLASARITYAVALSFYPLCPLLGLAIMLVADGSAKGWAPGTPTAATFANLIGYSVVVALVAVCATSCYWSYAHRGRSSA
jgi:hypothetical protein